MAAETRVENDARQNVITTVRELGAGLSGALMRIQDGSDPLLMRSAANDGAARFEVMVNALNTQAGGRSLFSGTSTDSAAVASADILLATLENEIAISAPTTAQVVESIVADWFAPGGGFETTGYLGSPQSLGIVQVSNSTETGSPPRADDQRIRDMLKATAMAALVARGTLAIGTAQEAALLKRSGTEILQADRGLVELQAEIGVEEQKIERAGAENAAEEASLSYARNELLAVDPFESATELRDLESRLQALYAITSRLSRLSLAEYFR